MHDYLVHLVTGTCVWAWGGKRLQGLCKLSKAMSLLVFSLKKSVLERGKCSWCRQDLRRTGGKMRGRASINMHADSLWQSGAKPCIT